VSSRDGISPAIPPLYLSRSDGDEKRPALNLTQIRAMIDESRLSAHQTEDSHPQAATNITAPTRKAVERTVWITSNLLELAEDGREGHKCNDDYYTHDSLNLALSLSATQMPSTPKATTNIKAPTRKTVEWPGQTPTNHTRRAYTNPTLIHI